MNLMTDPPDLPDLTEPPRPAGRLRRDIHGRPELVMSEEIKKGYAHPRTPTPPERE